MQPKPLRILIVSPMPPAMGGISVSSERLVQNLRADGHTVHVLNLAPSPQGSGLTAKLAQVAALAWATFSVPFKVLFRQPYDIIHLHVSGYPRRVYFRLMQPLLRTAKIINTIHGDVTFYTRRPLSEWVLSAGHGVICVRPGDVEKLPASLQPKARHIPAFIMPNTLDRFPLPQRVSSLLQKAKAESVPLLVFNGALVTSQSQYDLYGFNLMAEAIALLKQQGQRFLSLVMVNDVELNEQKNELLQPMRNVLTPMGQDALLEIGSGFSMLPILANPMSIYVRPTSTDGDSLSVREAIALSAPVVASNVCPRPQQTILFSLQQGASALAEQIKKAFYSLPHTHTSVKSDGFYPQIVNFYRHITEL